MADNIVVEVVRPQTVVEAVADKTIIIEIVMRGPQGPPGPPGSGALDLPLAIANPQTGDVLVFNSALQTAGAWENLPKESITDGGFF
jgi:hypothetical protein